MELKFNVTGKERKALVTAITEVLNTPQTYCGAPTFAYDVGGCEIDKTGTLTGDVTQALADALLEKGFTPEASAEMEQSADRLIIELPLEGFDETALDNLEKLVLSKAELIKKALGASELPITRTETRVQFPWFGGELEPEKVDAYSRFITALTAMAKEQKRITAKEKSVDNEKYAFRCFLLRLGFIGEEYAAARKILLANLSGNSSFKSGERKEADTAAPVPHSGGMNDLGEALADAQLIRDVNATLGETNEVAV